MSHAVGNEGITGVLIMGHAEKFSDRRVNAALSQGDKL